MKLTDTQIAILDGCMLGDGHLTKPQQGQNSCFQYLSASKQHAEYVHSFFKNFCTETYQELKRRETFDKRTNKTYVHYFFRTMHLSTFTHQRIRWYRDKKIVAGDVILSSISLLFWYLGDGELDSTYGYIKLHTNNFTGSEVNSLCNKLIGYNAKPLKKKEKQFLVTIPRLKVGEFLNRIGMCPFEDYSHKWEQIPYKNKNIEQNGMSDHSFVLENFVEADWKKGGQTIYGLSIKHNVPIKSIKHYFDKKGINYKPVNRKKEIVELDLDGNFIKKWDSGQKLKDTHNYSASAISECCRGKRKTYMGRKWKFLKDYENE